MSCMQKILKMKGDEPFLKVDKNLVVEGGGNYKGFDYLITFVRSHRCGYVAIPPGHKLDNDKDYNDIDVQVHGGLTFGSREKFTSDMFDEDCNDKWLGFDVMHHGDSQDFDSCEKYGISYNPEWKWEDGTVKDYAYMESQCKYLIDQIAEM